MVLQPNYISSCCAQTRAFSLLETVLVMAIFSGVAAATLFVTASMYQSEVVRTERTTVVQLLQTARNYALTGRDGSSAGVAFNSGFPGYVLFIGDSLMQSATATRVYILRAPTVSLSPGTPFEVVFGAISGDVARSAVLLLEDIARTGVSTTVVINQTGYVGW